MSKRRNRLKSGSGSEEISRSPERMPSPTSSDQQQQTPTRSRSRKLAGFASRNNWLGEMFVLYRHPERSSSSSSGQYVKVNGGCSSTEHFSAVNEAALSKAIN
ncbi:hypothetical protein NECAME_10643, partial [Necator americanus]